MLQYVLFDATCSAVRENDLSMKVKGQQCESKARDQVIPIQPTSSIVMSRRTSPDDFVHVGYGRLSGGSVGPVGSDGAVVDVVVTLWEQ